MKLFHSLMMSVALFLIPIASSAGLIGGVIDRIFDDTTLAPIPEPSGALVMGVALTAVALVVRRKNR